MATRTWQRCTPTCAPFSRTCNFSPALPTCGRGAPRHAIASHRRHACACMASARPSRRWRRAHRRRMDERRRRQGGDERWRTGTGARRGARRQHLLLQTLSHITKWVEARPRRRPGRVPEQSTRAAQHQFRCASARRKRRARASHSPASTWRSCVHVRRRVRASRAHLAHRGAPVRAVPHLPVAVTSRTPTRGLRDTRARATCAVLRRRVCALRATPHTSSNSCWRMTSPPCRSRAQRRQRAC